MAKNVFQDQLLLNAGQSIAECSKGSILQYFLPSLSYNLSLRSLFCLFSSGRFSQVLLYLIIEQYLREVEKVSFAYNINHCLKPLALT